MKGSSLINDLTPENRDDSSYMRVRVAIDVTVLLKKEWRVRATNGAFVTVILNMKNWVSFVTCVV